MRAALDGRALGSGLGGDETMLRGWLRGLACTAREGDAFSVVLPDGATLPAEAAADERFATIAVRRRPGPLHFALTLPGVLRRLPLDVAFSVTHAPLLPGVPVALMVNDLSFLRRPGDYPVASRARLRAMVAAQVRAASVVTTVSEFCRDDILDAYRLDPGRVLVVPNTFDPPLDLGPEEKESGQDWLRARG